jgi:hypothetical protein
VSGPEEAIPLIRECWGVSPFGERGT